MRYIAIVGTRRLNANANKLVFDYVAHLPANTVVVAGCASGVDKYAVNASMYHKLNYIVCYANWHRGKQAGPERNSSIVRIADEVMAFPDCSSVGTWDTVRKFKLAEKPWKTVCVTCGREGRECRNG